MVRSIHELDSGLITIKILRDVQAVAPRQQLSLLIIQNYPPFTVMHKDYALPHAMPPN